MKPENIELCDKIMFGINKAVKKLYTEGAARNEQFVVADDDGNVRMADAKDLLNSLLEKESLQAAKS